MNGGGYVNFSSADIINMIDNVATESVRSGEYRMLHNMYTIHIITAEVHYAFVGGYRLDLT